MADYDTRHRGILSEDKRSLFIPLSQGLWIKTDPCVRERSCPQCGAEKYAPCIGNGCLPTATTHAVRGDHHTQRDLEKDAARIRRLLKDGPATFQGVTMAADLSVKQSREVLNMLVDKNQIRAVLGTEPLQYELVHG